MALSPKLEFRQSQTLVMTPQLMQAIKLLQLSNLDLTAFVEAELERNPLLERSEEDGAALAPTEADGLNGSAAAVSPESSPDLSVGAIDTGSDTDLANAFPDDLDPARTPVEGPPPLPTESWTSAPNRQPISSDDYNLEAFVSNESTLSEHLVEQLGLAVSDPASRMIGRAIIGEIDEAGYLRSDLDGIAMQLAASRNDVEHVLGIIHSFDPAGIGARNLEECLAIQLRERNRYDPAMATFVANLDRVAQRDFSGLAKLCGVDAEDLAEMLAELKTLNPKPGNAFGATALQPVIPDVLVRPANDGSWHVELNTETLPKVLVDHAYYARVARPGTSDKDSTFVTDCMQTAKWLVKSLDQRARTILKVAIEIVRQQDDFLTHGVQHLRPLNLKTVADAIEMHELTVSRVTSNKYIATNRGIFELKYFFTAAIASAEGGLAHSAEAVRHRIKRLIDEEQASSVLSDDAIVTSLRGSGIDIARRTVAKYRESMRIPSSVQRRRDKRAAL